MINIREFLNLGFYTSEPDQFLSEFDKNNPKMTASQQAEKEKYARVYQLRDNPLAPVAKTSFWKNF